MSKSNNIVKWSDGNNIVDSGISITSIGSGGIVANSGSFSKANNDTTNTVVSHSLNKTPTNISFYSGGIKDLITMFYIGTYNASGNKCIGLINSAGTTTNVGIDSGDFIVKLYYPTNGANYVLGNVSEVTSSNFTMTWTKTGSTLGGESYVITWNAIA